MGVCWKNSSCQNQGVWSNPLTMTDLRTSPASRLPILVIWIRKTQWWSRVPLFTPKPERTWDGMSCVCPKLSKGRLTVFISSHFARWWCDQYPTFVANHLSLILTAASGCFWVASHRRSSFHPADSTSSFYCLDSTSLLAVFQRYRYWESNVAGKSTIVIDDVH